MKENRFLSLCWYYTR